LVEDVGAGAAAAERCGDAGGESREQDETERRRFAVRLHGRRLSAKLVPSATGAIARVVLAPETLSAIEPLARRSK
jgi:hypothetical protein